MEGFKPQLRIGLLKSSNLIVTAILAANGNPGNDKSGPPPDTQPRLGPAGSGSQQGPLEGPTGSVTSGSRDPGPVKASCALTAALLCCRWVSRSWR